LKGRALGEELAEALDIVELVGVDVVVVELLEDRQIFGGLLGVVHLVVPSLCGSSRFGRWLEVAMKAIFLLLALEVREQLSATPPSRSEAPIN
jgi:hypothetical protein